MQQTKKYGLKLIEMSDTFTPDALNLSMEKVEEVLAKQEESLANREESVSNTLAEQEKSLAKTLAEQKESLTKALAEQKESLTNALAGKGTCTVTVNSYLGDGQRQRDFNLGFTPKVVFLLGTGPEITMLTQGIGFYYQRDGFYAIYSALTGTGFRLGGTQHNESGKTMWYVAFS